MARKHNDTVLAPLEDGNQKYAIRSNADIVAFVGQTGSGKQNPLDEPVLTVNGWIKMGDLKIGDELFSPLNTEQSFVTGIYPQGVKPVYKVTTSDGRTSRCGLEHLWMVRTEKQVANYRKGKGSAYIKTTREILDEYISKGKSIFIPLARPYDGKEKELPIDPYVFGVWLGDGCCHSNIISVSNDEPDIIKKISERLGTTHHLHGNKNYHNLIHQNDKTREILSTLKKIGLDVYSRERFIPEEYLHASVEQRMELLKGLMDSDGYIGEKNKYSFSTTSPKLKRDFVELCRGLGYIVGENKDSRTRYKSGECWKITIQTNDIIFSSKKHLAKYNKNIKKYKNKNREYKHDHIRITNIEYVGDMECQCIMVSNKDHVYCTHDYIVTHNTIALYYSPIEYLAMNDNAKSVCFMRNVSDFWATGKVADSIKQMYPLIDRGAGKKQPHDPIGEIRRGQEDMGVKFYNGSEIKFQQLDNENPIVIDKITKGLQAKILIFDECNKFQWRTISSFFPRLRSDSEGKAQVFLAQNPERECFMRKLCGKSEHGGGWINDDGTIDKSMDGAVMFVYFPDGDYEKAIWGKTKEEVYQKGKGLIDKLLSVDPDMSYEDFILSFAFFTFDVRDNKKMLAKNKKYRGLAANSATAKSSYENNWNYSLEDEEGDVEDLAKTLLHSVDIERMFRKTEPLQNSSCIKRFMTVDYATTGFDNLVLKYWELWEHYGFVCKDIKFSVKNSNREAVIMMIDFRDRHGLREQDMIIDVQGSTFLRDCFPKAMNFAGASQPTERSKAQFKTKKDEAAHICLEMVQSGLIHYDPSLAEAKYNHQNMKREGGTTILRHMKFESVIFQFGKTPNGRITFLDKEKQKTLLKGMSPDLFDNVIMLCGALYHTCYNMLRDDAGVMRKKMQSDDMLSMLNVNGQEEDDTRIHRVKKIRNASEILNVLSTI